ncbi:MAG: Adenine-specific methyltransferase [Gemmatimonadetes bacterium]|nr:Adenine-specific methyltransferase [Gemmatimonadota bacterium]
MLAGDCRTVIPTLGEASIASVVTDPPYHLTGATRFGNTRSERGFMNKAWDGGDVAFNPETWATVARVVRPGGYLLASGGTRTYHRLACAAEDGGWEIVDCLAWLYGQGFPKHASKLKPAFEPILMARTPGPMHALAIDECRIGFANASDEAEAKGKNRHADFGSGARKNQVYGADHRARGENGNYDAPGRWPANVILDETAAAALDAQAGDRRASSRGVRTTKNIMKLGGANRRPSHGDADGSARPGYADAGGASRFFYCPKASRAERDAGLDGMRNNHPTVKPIALMRWLVRLVTPRGGVVLDPFAGSGSTGAACAMDGVPFVGVDITPEYVEIARRRIIHWRRDELFGVAE